jgi:hypothetical protein
MCQCPDGSYAGLHTGCRTQPSPSGTTHARQLSDWLHKNGARLVGDLKERNKKGLEYALSNEEFINALAGVLASKSAIPRHLVGNVQAQVIDAIAHTTLDVGDFARGNHYEATLHIVNTVSATTLAVLKPWGGNTADAINVGGAFGIRPPYFLRQL